MKAPKIDHNRRRAGSNNNIMGANGSLYNKISLHCVIKVIKWSGVLMIFFLKVWP